jgi:nucleotide-binding universal stress UspA family protein
MFAPTRILAPVDFSGASDVALRSALDLARRTGADLHVLHAVPGPYPDAGTSFDGLSGDDRSFYRWVWNHADGELSALLDGISPNGTRIERVLTGGPPSHVVLDYAAQEGIDFIVMGTHGRRGLRRLVLGSVAEDVLRRTEIPVLVVPETVPRRTPRRVLAPTDFSLASRLALPLAAEVAALYGADLDLLHVLEPVRFVEVIAGTQLAAGLLPELRDEAERRLDALADSRALVETLRDPEAPIEGGVPARIEVRLAEGRAAESIAEVAQSERADVVVMAKRGLHGVERPLLGSVTERLCRLAPCPVLVVPIGADDEDDAATDPDAAR